jgi:hypothetical protein
MKVKRISSLPKKRSRILNRAAPKVAWPEVYEGKAGVKLLSPGRGLLA